MGGKQRWQALKNGEAYGPKMAALTEKQRNYVKAMAANPFGTSADWARAAGYFEGSNGKRPSGGLRVQAYRLRSDPKIEAAIFEYASHVMHRDGPLLAVVGMMEIARNKEHPKQLAALIAIANRSGLHEMTEHRVRVEHTEESAELKAERIRMVAGLLGVDVTQLLGANNVSRETKVIEHKQSE